MGTMGFPYAILPNTKQLVDEVCALIKKEKIDGIVIGESKDLSGSENKIAEQAREFGDSIAHISKRPIFFESEVFTTVLARRAPEPAGGGSASGGKERKSRAPKQHTEVDASAAALILTSYLSRTNHG
jgi:RNase H-fold protein (predicted Holliday junction resolvase)